MICVFGSFVLSDLRVLKLIGFGLAFAVFIDATVVRLVLVPATMELLWRPQLVVPEGARMAARASTSKVHRPRRTRSPCASRNLHSAISGRIREARSARSMMSERPTPPRPPYGRCVAEREDGAGFSRLPSSPGRRASTPYRR